MIDRLQSVGFEAQSLNGALDPWSCTMYKKSSKWGSGNKLETLSIDEMPKYISQNLNKYKLWLDLNK